MTVLKGRLNYLLFLSLLDKKEDTCTDPPHVLPPQQISIMQEKPFKTELIIPKVHTMDKSLIKEERESPNEPPSMNLLNMTSNLNPKEENNHFKDNLFMPQNLNMKEPISFGMKDPPFMNHLPPKHNLSLKELPIDMHKEQIVNMNHSNFVNNTNDIKPESYGYQNPPPPQPQPEKSTAGKVHLLYSFTHFFNFIGENVCLLCVNNYTGFC